MALDFNRRTCVYTAFDQDGKVLYVGISTQPKARIKDHKRKGWFSYAIKFELQWFDDRFLAMQAERQAIAQHNPIGNVIHNKDYKRVGRACGYYVRVAHA